MLITARFLLSLIFSIYTALFISFPSYANPYLNVVFDECENIHENQNRKWTPVDREQVENLINNLRKTFDQKPPNLTLPEEIRIFRVSSRYYKDLFGNFSPAEAYSTERSIFLTDLFFKNESKLQLLEITHELMHIADVGSHLSYSPEWIQFANPRLNKIRQLIASTDSSKLFNLQQRVHDQNEWPGLHSAISLREGFADYLSTSLVDPTFTVAPEFTSLKECLIHLNAAKSLWIKNYYCGVDAFNSCDYQGALKFFQTCIELDPASPMPIVYSARCFFHERQFSMCIEKINEALQCFSTAKIPSTEEVVINSRKLLQNATIALKQRAAPKDNTGQRYSDGWR